MKIRVHTRDLIDPADFTNLQVLLLRDGPNQWNYITEESIEHQFQLLRQGTAVAILAEQDTEDSTTPPPPDDDDDNTGSSSIIGFAVLILKDAACPPNLMTNKYYTDELSTTAYINDVVVSVHHVGKGIGTQLLQTAVEYAKEHHINCQTIYIERHEENLASAGMMRKAGFQIVETYHDPARRTSGSRNTSVLSLSTVMGITK
jgi:ribosomal protein S18 acetylase RimI-like enzyme